MAVNTTEVDEIFCAAIELSSAERRADFVQQACGQNAELKLRVEELLAAHFAAGSFMEPLKATVQSSIERAIQEGPGTKIGRYKLLEAIGEGGFGVVFMAEQEQPVRRRVALKIIKAGMDTRQVVARFEAERQALAMMDHSNIAKVFDAGATDTGRPYFVMELVKGIPITSYCDESGVNTKTRLKLFISVCSAVQHAHQKGIIHRDLKPTNVLVTMHDDKPVPKIIDFGIAKATQARLTEKTLFTEFRQLIGTPAYMSPEQAQMSGLDVDTRSDIYSLGVLLYELLTGTTPFDSSELLHSGYDEMRRIIREVEPQRPSIRLSTLAASAQVTRANERNSDLRDLSRLLRGDLDWIVMKCLEKDRTRRYPTAIALAADLQRYLDDEPVEARRPTRLYRLTKFVRRNKVGVLAALVTAAALVIGMTIALAGFVQARRQAEIAAAEAAKATSISDLIQEALQSADPDKAKGADYTVRQLLDDFAGGLANQLAGQPEVEAEIRATIGNAYRRLGLFDLAGAQFETALALQRRVDGYEQENYAGILVDYAQNLAEQRRIVDAERTAREAIRIFRGTGTSGRALVKALWVLQLQLAFRAELSAHTATANSIYDEEQALVEEALAIAEAEGTEYPELANMLHRHAPLMSQQGNQEGAEEYARRAVAMHRRLQGNEHPETAYGLADLGRVLADRKKYGEAESAFREALTIFRRSYGDKRDVALLVQEELDQTIRADGAASGLEVHQREPDGTPQNIEQGAGSLAANRSLRLAQDALERELRDALKTLASELAGSPHDQSLRLSQAATYRKLAEFDVRQSRIDEAIDHYRTGIEIASLLVNDQPKDPAYAEERARAQLGLAETLATAKRMDESLAAFDALLSANEEAGAAFAKDNWFRTIVVDTCTRMSDVLAIDALRAPKQVEQGHKLLRRALTQLDKIGSAADVTSSMELADMYIRVGQNLAASSEQNVEVGEVERRLIALLQTVAEQNTNSAFARGQVGHRWRLWAFALPWTDEYHTSAEGSLQRAIAVFEKLTVDFPDASESWHFLADTHRCLGRSYEWKENNDAAEAEYRLAVELFDAHPEAAHINDFERAFSYLDLASILGRMGRLTEAEAPYRKGRTIFEESMPASADGCNQLAWRLATFPVKQFRDPHGAVELATKAVELAPQNGNYWNTLGVAQYRAGEWQAAIETLNKSMGLRDGGDALDWYFLAMAKWQLKQKDEARMWYDKGVEWTDKHQPDEEELRRFRAEASELLGITQFQPAAAPATRP